MKNLDRAKNLISNVNAKEFTASGAMGVLHLLGHDAQEVVKAMVICKDEESKEKIQALEDWLNSEYLGARNEMHIIAERKEPAVQIFSLVSWFGDNVKTAKTCIFDPENRTAEYVEQLNIDEIRMILNKMVELGYGKV